LKPKPSTNTATWPLPSLPSHWEQPWRATLPTAQPPIHAMSWPSVDSLSSPSS